MYGRTQHRRAVVKRSLRVSATRAANNRQTQQQSHSMQLTPLRGPDNTKYDARNMQTNTAQIPHLLHSRCYHTTRPTAQHHTAVSLSHGISHSTLSVASRSVLPDFSLSQSFSLSHANSCDVRSLLFSAHIAAIGSDAAGLSVLALFVSRRARCMNASTTLSLSLLSSSH